MSNTIAPPSPPTQLVLGRYRPLRPLGSGGSGSVWLARDEASGLEIALKIVPREGKAGARAEREAVAAARLRHDRCLRAYALESDERHVYIAYEYVPGQTLRQCLRAGELTDEDVVEVAAQVLDGLAHAHANGIVHRDVKPANVLLAEGDEVSARVCDFGLAQFAEADTLTAAGDVPGTLAYISPERLRGETAAPAADVWSVGVFLWEALAARHPFWAASPLDTARKIEAGAPPLKQARPDLPKPLLAAVERALALDPARRPAAAKLAAALRSAYDERRAKRRPHPSAPATAPAARAVAAGSKPLAAALAALLVGWVVSALPFYPDGWALGLAALTGALVLARERAGLAFALAVPVLPLGNLSQGLALLYAAFAVCWLALCWRDPGRSLLFVLGPLLAPLAALGLLPLAAEGARSVVRRAVQVAAAVLAAALVAGIGGEPLPFSGDSAPGTLAIAGDERPLNVAGGLWNALAAHPVLLVQAVALGAAAAALPFAARRGPWGIAGLGAGMLGATLLPAPALSALPLVACVWLTCIVLLLRTDHELRERLLGTARRLG